MERVRCISCGSYINVGGGSVKFPCPGCGEIIGRCRNCRDLGREYQCKCGVQGP